MEWHYPLPADPRCGVVLGSYSWFGDSLLRLQLAAIRRYAGDVPVLISEDCGPSWREVEALGRLPGVDVVVSPQRVGHAGGDLGAFSRGVHWAAGLGLEYLVKLSTRLVVTVPRWLQDGARELQRARLPVSSRRCQEGPHRFDIRSECVLLHVPSWNREDLLGYLAPRPIGGAAEIIVWDAIRRFLGGRMHPWSLFGPYRTTCYPGVTWHVSHTTEDYHRLADRLGVTLSPHFTAAGSHTIPAWAGGYKVG